MIKKAQIWSLDIMMAMGLFLVGILIFYMYTLNNSNESYDSFELLSYDADSIADNLMSEGYPANWDSANVITIGLTTNNRINRTKLESLYDMVYTNNNYTRTKNIFNTLYDYYFFFDDNMTIYGNPIEGIGKPGSTKDSIDAKNLVKVTRFVIYENKTVPFYLYIWED